MIAKTLNPIVGNTADHNFVESLNFLQRLNETTVKNGVGVQRMANRLTDIDRDTRKKFIDVAGSVFQKSGGTPVRNVSAPAPYAIPAYSTPSYSTSSHSPRYENQQATPVAGSMSRPQFHYGQPLRSDRQGTAQTGYVRPQNPNHYSQPPRQAPMQRAYPQSPGQPVMRPNGNQPLPAMRQGSPPRSSMRTYHPPAYPPRNYR